MFGGIDPFLLLASLVVASVPILLAALGELVAERAGVLNLGVEGMMILGAVCGFVTAVESGSPALGFAAGAGAGLALAALFALLTQFLLTNQVATGLALTLFGLGLSSLLGQGYNGIKPPPTGPLFPESLSGLSGLGGLIFGYDGVAYLSVALVPLIALFLMRSRPGLILRAIGENPEAAHALGYRVRAWRWGALLFGGALAGLGGAYISLVRVPQWTDGITAGAGWIALAIVVFASWRPWRVLAGAWLFGGVTVLQLNLQAAGARIPVEYLSMSPYLMTILVLVAISAGKGRAALSAPAALGQNFRPQS